MATTINYYGSQYNALTTTAILHTGNSQTISYSGPEGQYMIWRIASNSTGISTPGATIYNFGSTLPYSGIYYLYPAVPTINYYPSLTDAINYTNIYINNIKIDDLYVVASPAIGSITQWRIASNSEGEAEI